MSTIVKFPGLPEREKEAPSLEPTGEKRYGAGRSRRAVQADIDAHIKARKAYGKTVAWEAAARDEDLPAYRIEEARANTAMACREMMEAGRHLLICMPTDPKGLVDLLMYLEKNFSVLPQEVSNGGPGEGQSLAFHLLRTVRLSLRDITKYGKYGPTS